MHSSQQISHHSGIFGPIHKGSGYIDKVCCALRRQRRREIVLPHYGYECRPGVFHRRVGRLRSPCRVPPFFVDKPVVVYVLHFVPLPRADRLPMFGSPFFRKPRAGSSCPASSLAAGWVFPRGDIASLQLPHTVIGLRYIIFYLFWDRLVDSRAATAGHGSLAEKGFPLFSSSGTGLDEDLSLWRFWFPFFHVPGGTGQTSLSRVSAFFFLCGDFCPACSVSALGRVFSRVCGFLVLVFRLTLLIRSTTVRFLGTPQFRIKEEKALADIFKSCGISDECPSHEEIESSRYSLRHQMMHECDILSTGQGPHTQLLKQLSHRGKASCERPYSTAAVDTSSV